MARAGWAGLLLLLAGAPAVADLLVRGGALDGERIAALATRVTMRIAGVVGRVEVTQSFRNAGQDWLEATYVFPLPEGAAVDRLQMVIDDRELEGQIQEKAAARKTYERAKKAGQHTSLLEQARPNIFSAAVANIPPGAEISIRIGYQQTVDYKNGWFSLRFPMVVAPRFSEGDSETPSPALKVVHQPDRIHNPLRLQITLHAAALVEEVRSPTHDIEVIDDGDGQQITLRAGAVAADRDFALMWKPVAGVSAAGYALAERGVDQNHVLFLLMPPDENLWVPHAVARELIFVIDTSGSMSGQSLQQAVAALRTALSRLDVGNRFNIFQFSDSVDGLFPGAVEASEDNIAAADAWLAGLRAEGGTMMSRALSAALSGPTGADRLRQVVFLTDGAVGNEEVLFERIQDKLGDSRLFMIGIGSAPNDHFMKRAARFGRGSHVHIAALDQVEERMAQLFLKLERPALTDIEIDWPTDAQVWPRRVADLYAGEPLILTARLSALPRTLQVRGRLGEELREFTVVPEWIEPGAGISQMWARRKIAALMDGLNKNPDAVRQAVVATAKQHHLLSRFTSLVAVDVTPVRAPADVLVGGQVPSNLPHGQDPRAVIGAWPATGLGIGRSLWTGLLAVLLWWLLGVIRSRRVVWS